MLTLWRVERAEEVYRRAMEERGWNVQGMYVGAPRMVALHGCASHGYNPCRPLHAGVADRFYTDVRSILMGLWGHFKGTASSTLEAEMGVASGGGPTPARACDNSNPTPPQPHPLNLLENTVGLHRPPFYSVVPPLERDGMPPISVLSREGSSATFAFC